MDFSMWLSLEETALHKSQEEEDDDDDTITTIITTTTKNQNKSDFVVDFVLQKIWIGGTEYTEYKDKQKQRRIYKAKEKREWIIRILI